MATKVSKTPKTSKPRLNRKRHAVLPPEWGHQKSSRKDEEIAPLDLIRFRLKHHLSQDQVAMLCRVSQTAVNRWEKDFLKGHDVPRMPLPYWELLRARLGYPLASAADVFVQRGLPPKGEPSMLRRTASLVAAGADELLPPTYGRLMPILTAEEADRQLALKQAGKWKGEHIPMRFTGRLPDDARRTVPKETTTKAAKKKVKKAAKTAAKKVARKGAAVKVGSKAGPRKRSAVASKKAKRTKGA